MTKFKPKTNKNIKVNKNSILTVDKKHEEMIEKINKNDIKIPILKSKINELNRQLKNTTEYIKKIEIKQLIQRKKDELKEFIKFKEDYYLNHSSYLFDYFENKKQIIDNNNKKRIVSNFFNKNKKMDNKLSSSFNTFKNSDTHKHYFTDLDESFLSMKDYMEEYDKCKYCNNEMISVEHEGVLICTNCSVISDYLVEHDKPSYKEPPKEVSFYAYKRINHFREIIAQFQAKESTHIDDEVIENIKKQIKKERIELHQLTNDKTKQILKNLGYNKYYEHISFIKEKLGIFPPRMSMELEQKLCNLFLEIQKPYAKYCPIDRVNFLNYYYVLYKLCELLREDEYLPYFYMLKDPEKRNEQDEIWKEICKDLYWEFIPTP